MKNCTALCVCLFWTLLHCTKPPAEPPASPPKTAPAMRPPTGKKGPPAMLPPVPIRVETDRVGHAAREEPPVGENHREGKTRILIESCFAV